MHMPDVTGRAATERAGAVVAARALALLEELVRIPTWQPEGEGQALRHLAGWLRRQGLPAELHEQDGHPLALTSTVGPTRAPAAGLVFNSHIDTVPPGDPGGWPHPPLQVSRDGDLLYGLGVCDAKGSVAAMAAAFCELASGWPGPGPLQLAVVGGEERGGLGTRLLLRRQALAGSVIVGEPTALIPRHASKGVLRLEVTSRGRAAHASQPETGFNALYPMGALLVRLEALSAQVRQREERWTGRASLVVTLIQGGTAHNVVPSACRIHIDRRLIPGETADAAEAEVAAVVDVVAHEHPGAFFALERVRVLEPVLTPPSEPVVAAVVEAASRLADAGTVGSGETMLQGFPATCDLSWIAHAGGLAGVIWGPGILELAHQVDESLPLEHLYRAVDGYITAGHAWPHHAAGHPPAAAGKAGS